MFADCQQRDLLVVADDARFFDGIEPDFAMLSASGLTA